MAMKLSNTCYVNMKLWQQLGVTFLDKGLESFNNSHMYQWIYFDGLPQKQDQLENNSRGSTIDQKVAVHWVVMTTPSKQYNNTIQYLLVLKSFFYFFFLLLSLLSAVLFDDIVKKAISSQNTINPVDFSTQDIIQKCSLLSCAFNNLVISYFLCSFCLLHSPPAPYFKALQIFPLQFSQCPGL